MTNSGSFASWLTLATLVIAPFIGSFLGVVIDRLPRGETILAGRSRCDTCGTVLGARDLVPLASFALLRGRCRHCHAKIPRALLVVELAALAVTAVILAAIRYSNFYAGVAAALAAHALLSQAQGSLATGPVPAPRGGPDGADDPQVALPRPVQFHQDDPLPGAQHQPTFIYRHRH